jgi:Leucine-rich repeat (LRR) protein
MQFSPEKIWEEFERNRINQQTAADLLTSLIEKSKKDEIRLNALNKLVKIIPTGEKLFKILENLVVSDENVKIRYMAIKYIGEKYLNAVFILLKWAIKNESDYNCLIEIVNLLDKLNIAKTKAVLSTQVQKFLKKRYMNTERKVENKKFKNVLKKLLKEKDYGEFNHDELSKILKNILTISHLFMQYHNVYYELNPQNGLIEKLDLSDIEYEVKGTPWNWKNNITALSEIIGIENLTSMRYLDLSNNQITDLKEFANLPNLTHLILKNNRISKPENLDHLNKMPNLKYLDLRGNVITKNINKNNFNPNIRVLLQDSHIKIE